MKQLTAGVHDFGCGASSISGGYYLFAEEPLKTEKNTRRRTVQQYGVYSVILIGAQPHLVPSIIQISIQT